MHADAITLIFDLCLQRRRLTREGRGGILQRGLQEKVDNQTRQAVRVYGGDAVPGHMDIIRAMNEICAVQGLIGHVNFQKVRAFYVMDGTQDLDALIRLQKEVEQARRHAGMHACVHTVLWLIDMVDICADYSAIRDRLMPLVPETFHTLYLLSNKLDSGAIDDLKWVAAVPAIIFWEACGHSSTPGIYTADFSRLRITKEEIRQLTFHRIAQRLISMEEEAQNGAAFAPYLEKIGSPASDSSLYQYLRSHVKEKMVPAEFFCAVLPAEAEGAKQLVETIWEDNRGVFEPGQIAMEIAREWRESVLSRMQAEPQIGALRRYFQQSVLEMLSGVRHYIHRDREQHRGQWAEHKGSGKKQLMESREHYLLGCMYQAADLFLQHRAAEIMDQAVTCLEEACRSLCAAMQAYEQRLKSYLREEVIISPERLVSITDAAKGIDKAIAEQAEGITKEALPQNLAYCAQDDGEFRKAWGAALDALSKRINEEEQDIIHSLRGSNVVEIQSYLLQQLGSTGMLLSSRVPITRDMSEKDYYIVSGRLQPKLMPEHGVTGMDDETVYEAFDNAERIRIIRLEEKHIREGDAVTAFLPGWKRVIRAPERPARPAEEPRGPQHAPPRESGWDMSMQAPFKLFVEWDDAGQQNGRVNIRRVDESGAQVGAPITLGVMEAGGGVDVSPLIGLGKNTLVLQDSQGRELCRKTFDGRKIQFGWQCIKRGAVKPVPGIRLYKYVIRIPDDIDFQGFTQGFSNNLAVWVPMGLTAQFAFRLPAPEYKKNAYQFVCYLPGGSFSLKGIGDGEALFDPVLVLDGRQ